jgi:hypothetical protein
MGMAHDRHDPDTPKTRSRSKTGQRRRPSGTPIALPATIEAMTSARSRVRSPQTLSEADRRIVAEWAADCAQRVLQFFETEAPDDARPRDAINGLRDFARGQLRVWPARSLAGHAHAAAREVAGKPAAVAAARAAGQAAATAHMGAHALGAAAYAAKAVGLAHPEQPDAVASEIRWQLDDLSGAVQAALRLLPPVGTSKAGPIGPGLLASGQLGAIVNQLQADLAKTRARERQQPDSSGSDPDRRLHDLHLTRRMTGAVPLRRSSW